MSIKWGDGGGRGHDERRWGGYTQWGGRGEERGGIRSDRMRGRPLGHRRGREGGERGGGDRSWG